MASKQLLSFQDRREIRVSGILYGEELAAMKGETREKWQHLCSQAAEEQDPERLMELVAEINRLLEEKERRLLRTKADEQHETKAAD